MTDQSVASTIYVGNIQSIPEEQIREYFQSFAPVQSIYRHCPSAQDEWLIDYRFVQFAPGTDLTPFLSNQVDHSICRIRLDIHSYDAAVRDDTRLVSDRKICIAHTDPKLNRNVVKKAFSRYGRILNCNCVSSGHGIEYVYIEFESVNSVVAVCDSTKAHFAGKTRLAVRRTLRPSQVSVKTEPTVVPDRTRLETVQYSSTANRIKQSSNRHSSPLARVNRDDDPSGRCSVSSTSSKSTRIASPVVREIPSVEACSDERLQELENEYELPIREDFDRISNEIERFLKEQSRSYRKLRQDWREKVHHYSRSSSDNEDGAIVDSTSQRSDHRKKRRQSRH